MENVKKCISLTTLVKLAVDILVILEVYKLYITKNKNLAIVFIGIYVLIKITWIIKAIRRRKLKREFNELFPE